jgi:hypothetical protein
MKNFSLIFLMCFSVGLQGVSPGEMNTISAAAQEMLNVVQQKWSTSFPELTALLDTMETNLCGVVVSGASTDANDNYVNGSSGLQITVGGTNTNPTYSYTNCTGGAMSNLSLQAAQINYWGNIINNGDWETGYNACATNYQNGSRVDGSSFYSDIPAINAYTTEIQTQINTIIAENVNADGSSNPSNYDLASTMTNNTLFTLASSLSNTQNFNTTQMFTLYSAIGSQSGSYNGSAAQQYNAAAANFTSCYNAAISGGATCPTSTPFCSDEFSDYLAAVQGYAAAEEAFFDFMLKYVPNLGCKYSIKTQAAPMVACLLPSKCSWTTDANGAKVCNYDAPFFTFAENVNTVTQRLDTLVNTVLKASQNYSNQLQTAYTRLQAIVSQINNVLVPGIKSNQTALQAIVTTCKSDVAKEAQADLAGKIIGMVLVAGGILIALPALGAIAPELGEFAMALTATPTFGTDVFTPTQNFLSSNITKGINMAGHGVNVAGDAIASLPSIIVNKIVNG